MSVTDNERREVAARLRLLPDQRGIYSDRQFFELLDEKIFCLLDKALDNPRGFHTWVSNIFYLADLIEPEPERTCRMEPGKRGYPICSNCGEEMDAYTCEWSEPMEYSYPFCYACGARVKENIDAN